MYNVCGCMCIEYKRMHFHADVFLSLPFGPKLETRNKILNWPMPFHENTSLWEFTVHPNTPKTIGSN